MLLDDLIIAVYCLVDDELKALMPCLPGGRVRQSGPCCKLSDSEVLCMEVVGLFLQHSSDRALFDYFRLHHQALFPALSRLHRTSFVRQSANLWRIKELVWQRLVAQLPHHSSLSFIDSVPLPVCRFARATFCQRFNAEDLQGLKATYGKDHVARQTFYGFRLHVRVAFPGVITAFSLTGAHVADVSAAPEVLFGSHGHVLGDRNYHSPALQEHLKDETPEVRLHTPPKKKGEQEDRHRSRFITRLRYRIETVFGQWCERLQLKTVRARDTWHLASRLLRAVLCHTVLLHLTYSQNLKPLQFAKLLD